MFRNFFVCNKNEVSEIIERENKNHNSAPKVYYAGCTQYSAWLYEDFTPDYDVTNISCYCVDYSVGEDDEVFDKFFNYMTIETIKNRTYAEVVVSGEMYNIDVYINDIEHYCLDDFWHTSELSEEEIKCLNDLAA